MDMYIQASNAPLPPKTAILDPTRRTANFHPSIWGNHFLKYASDRTKSDGGAEEQHEQLKEEVRKKLLAVNQTGDQQLIKLIDTIQRLGIAYHFESEIDVALNNQLLKLKEDDGDDDLHMVSLRFRLLRQQGHRVSCGVFSKFKDSEGRFKESLISDVRGLLSLYEAAHMRVHKEDILEQALEFTTTHLNQVVKSSSLINDRVLASQVVHALHNWPIRKSLTRLQASHYIPVYQQDNSRDETLLKFAKLDFNMLQKIHQRELGDITRWYKDLNVAEKLPFARDRLVEFYFWVMGVYFEPQYFLARRILTKVGAMTSLIDDTYDVYGTFEELKLFTDAIQRWDINAKNELPEYMQHVYGALLDVYSEMDEEFSKDGISYRVEYAKQAMKQLTKAYFDESIWYHNGYVPTVEEYMKVAMVTSGYFMLAITSLVGMGELVTKEAFDWVSSKPLIVQASAIEARLANDMAGHEIEQERGHVASVIECYMKEHGGCATKEQAFVEFKKRTCNAWKDMNQEHHRSAAVPMVLLYRVINLARVSYLMYNKDEDEYTNSKTLSKNHITSVLIDSFPV